jgi:hypothetical protein
MNTQHQTIAYPTIYIDTIYYDPSYKKLIATSMHFYNSLEIEDTSYTKTNESWQGRYIIGYRADTNSIWKLYPWEGPIIYISFSDRTELKQALRHSLLHNLTSLAEWKNDPSTGQKASLMNKYNIGHKDFWTSSVIWTKSLLVDSLYNFECNGNVSRLDPRPIDSNIVIKYNDSILNCYK